MELKMCDLGFIEMIYKTHDISFRGICGILLIHVSAWIYLFYYAAGGGVEYKFGTHVCYLFVIATKIYMTLDVQQ